MNYDKKYEIRLARLSDVNDIMLFIDRYWRKNHILARNKDIFMYEHVDGNSVNFLLAINRNNGAIDGVLGYIPASKDLSRLDIWTGIWKVKNNALPLLGMELYKRLASMVGARSMLGVGDSQISTGPLLRTLTKNFNTWRMNHFYFLNEKDNYQLAYIINRPKKKSPDMSKVAKVEELINIEQVEKFIDLSIIDGYPFKDLWYIEHRYFEHPAYKYHIFGLCLDSNKALMIVRIQEYKDSCAIRIVDYIGDQICFSGICSFVSTYLNEINGEYADFYVHGFNNEHIFNAGFVERVKDDKNIIPNYFYPFEKKNVDIWVSGNIEEGLFVKADGDQDRPN